MEKPSSDEKTVAAVDDPSGEAALGGADAVNDIPAIASHGTTPGSPFRVVTPTGERPGGNKLIWLAVLVAIGAVLAYAAGMLR